MKIMNCITVEDGPGSFGNMTPSYNDDDGNLNYNESTGGSVSDSSQESIEDF